MVEMRTDNRSRILGDSSSYNDLELHVLFGLLFDWHPKTGHRIADSCAILRVCDCPERSG